MRERRLSTVLLAGLALVVLALALVLLLVRLLTGRAAPVKPPAAIELRAGVPVGVEHSPAGALAAADSYLALSSQRIEQNPPGFAALVAEVYAPALREHVLSEAKEIRSSDPQNMANYAEGGRGLAIVAAARLDSYTATTATVTSWLEGIVWGPHLAPRQTWNLVDTTLAFHGGRWLVLDSHLDATPAPVPALIYVRAENDTAGAFARLDGMSSPAYGADG